MRQALQPHPDTPCPAVRTLDVEVVRTQGGVSLIYRLEGDLSALAIPAIAVAERVDGLWKHTCFEAFVAGEGAGYLEFNAAPSTRWAAYRFDSYRQGMAPLAAPPPRIETTTTTDTLEVRVTLAWPGRGARLGLTAVIEEVGGRLSYWALRHPAGQPDFHHADGFVLTL